MAMVRLSDTASLAAPGPALGIRRSVDRDDTAPIAHGTLRGLEDADDVQAELTVAEGLAARADAVEEVEALDLERLGRGQLRRLHVSGAVLHQDAVDVLASLDGEPLVVHLDLLGGRGVVVNDHLPAAADQRHTDLHR